MSQQSKWRLVIFIVLGCSLAGALIVSRVMRVPGYAGIHLSQIDSGKIREVGESVSGLAIESAMGEIETVPYVGATETADLSVSVVQANGTVVQSGKVYVWEERHPQPRVVAIDSEGVARFSSLAASKIVIYAVFLGPGRIDLQREMLTLSPGANTARLRLEEAAVSGRVLPSQEGTHAGEKLPFEPLYEGESAELTAALGHLVLTLEGARFTGPESLKFNPTTEGVFALSGLPRDRAWSLRLSSWNTFPQRLLRWRVAHVSPERIQLDPLANFVQFFWWLTPKAPGVVQAVIENRLPVVGKATITIEIQKGGAWHAYIGQAIELSGHDTIVVDFGRRVYPISKLRRTNFRAVVEPSAMEDEFLVVTLRTLHTVGAGGREYRLVGELGEQHPELKNRMRISGNLADNSTKSTDIARAVFVDSAFERRGMAVVRESNFTVVLPGNSEYYYFVTTLNKAALSARLFELADRALGEGVRLVDYLNLDRIAVGSTDARLGLPAEINEMLR